MQQGSQRRIAYYFGPTGGKTTVPVLDGMTPPPTIITPYGEERILRLCMREQRLQVDAAQQRTREWNARRVS